MQLLIAQKTFVFFRKFLHFSFTENFTKKTRKFFAFFESERNAKKWEMQKIVFSLKMQSFRETIFPFRRKPYPLCKDSNSWFTTVPLKPLSYQYWNRYCHFKIRWWWWTKLLLGLNFFIHKNFLQLKCASHFCTETTNEFNQMSKLLKLISNS